MSAAETNIKININDVWKDVDSVKINISDVWKDVTEVKINIGDTWKTVSGTLNGYIITEDWDGSPPGDWPCKNCAGDYCDGGNWNGWEADDHVCSASASESERTSIANSGQVTNFGRSNNTSYYQEVADGNKRACDLLFDVPETHPTKIFMRVYLYFTDGMLDFNTSSGLIHFIFTNSAMSGVGFRINIDHRPSTVREYPNAAYFTFENNSTTIEQQPDAAWDLRDYLEEWVYLEVMADATNNLVSMWIKGASDGSIITLWEDEPFTISQSDFTSMIISGWNNLGDNENTFWIDDIIVAESYIGT